MGRFTSLMVAEFQERVMLSCDEVMVSGAGGLLTVIVAKRCNMLTRSRFRCILVLSFSRGLPITERPGVS